MNFSSLLTVSFIAYFLSLTELLRQGDNADSSRCRRIPEPHHVQRGG